MKIDKGGRYYGGSDSPGPHWCIGDMIYFSRPDLIGYPPPCAQGCLSLCASIPAYGWTPGGYYINYGASISIIDNKWKAIGYGHYTNTNDIHEDWSTSYYFIFKSTIYNKSYSYNSKELINIVNKINKYRLPTVIKTDINTKKSERTKLLGN